MSLNCCPEWCAQEPGGHDATCPDAPMNQSKGEFVEASEAGAGAAIDAYAFLIKDGLDHKEAVQMAVMEAGEVAVCFAGIGSCGRGWCNHS